MTAGPRKWLPAQAYAFLVLCALAHRAGASAGKRELARETRANHTMITNVLADLHRQGHVAVEPDAAGGYAVRLTGQGRDHHAKLRAVAADTFGPALAVHYRYGRPPAWARALG